MSPRAKRRARAILQTAAPAAARETPPTRTLRREKRSPTRGRGASRGSRASSSALLGRRHETVADTPHGLDVVTRTLELLAQSLDVRIHGARRDVGLDPPDIV